VKYDMSDPRQVEIRKLYAEIKAIAAELELKTAEIKIKKARLEELIKDDPTARRPSDQASTDTGPMPKS
jgi:hypothetical protein